MNVLRPLLILLALACLTGAFDARRRRRRRRAVNFRPIVTSATINSRKKLGGSYSGWKDCAKEGGTCNCHGLVGYGFGSSSSKFNFRSVASSVKASNSVFGDPSSGNEKLSICKTHSCPSGQTSKCTNGFVYLDSAGQQQTQFDACFCYAGTTRLTNANAHVDIAERVKMLTFKVEAKRKLVGRKSLGSVLYLFRTSGLVKLAAFGQQEQDFEWFNHHGGAQWIWMLHVIPEEMTHVSFFVEAKQTDAFDYKQCPSITANTNAQKKTCLNTYDSREQYRSQCCPISKPGHSNTCEPMSWIIENDHLQYAGCENTVAVAGGMIASSMTSLDSVGLAYTSKASSSTQTNPWRMYDLGDVRDVKRVVVTGPTNDCLSRMFKGTGCDGISAISGYRAASSEGLIVGVSHNACSGTNCDGFVCGKAILANEDSSYTFDCGRSGRYVYIMLPGTSRKLDSTVVANIEASRIPEIRDVNLIVNGGFEETEMQGIDENFSSSNPNGWTRTKGTLQVRDLSNGIRLKDPFGFCLGVANDLKIRRIPCNSLKSVWVEYNDGYKNIGEQKCLAVRGNTNVKLENCANNKYQKIELFDDQMKSEFNSKCLFSQLFVANHQISTASCATKTAFNKFTVTQVYGGYAHEGEKIMDLKGGNVQQIISTMPGYRYSISFSFSRNPCVSKGQMKVRLNLPTYKNLGTVTHSKSGHSWKTGEFFWYAKRFSFVAESESATIRFESELSETTCGGIYLDDIQVRMDHIALSTASAISQGNPVSTFGKVKAINGDLNPHKADKACWRSNNHAAPWYSVDLGKNTLVKKLRIWRNRLQPDDELRDFNVLVDGNVCAKNVAKDMGHKDYIDIDCVAYGKTVKIQKVSTGSNQRMGFCEVQIFPGKSYGCNTQLCRTCVPPEAATQDDQCETCHAGRTAFNGKCIITPEWCADEGDTCECRGKIHFGKRLVNNERISFAKMKTFSTKVKTSTSSKKCSTSAMGGDPFASLISGLLGALGQKTTPKQCYCEKQCSLKIFGAAKADVQAKGTHGACQKGGHFSSSGGWCSSNKNDIDWVQLDLGEITTVTGVKTRGRADGNSEQFVKSYDLSTSSDGVTFYSVGRFDGNADRNTAVEQFFEPRDARYVRFQPLTYKNFPSMRIDALLCGNARRQLRVERQLNRRRLEGVDTSWMISHKTGDACTSGFSLCSASQIATLRDAYGDDQECFLGAYQGGSENFGKDCASSDVQGKHCCKDYSGGSVMNQASGVTGAINTFAERSLKAGTLLASLGALTEVTDSVGGFLDSTKDMMSTLNTVLMAVSKLPYIGPVATVMKTALTPFRTAFNGVASKIVSGAEKIAEKFDRIMLPAQSALASLDAIFATLLQVSTTGVEIFTWSKACAERSGLDIPVPESVLSNFHATTKLAAEGVNSILSGVPDVSPITEKLQKFMKMFEGVSKVGEAFEFLMDIPIVLPWVDIDECAAALGRRTLANGDIEENIVDPNEKYDEFILRRELPETVDRRLLSLNETGEIGLYDDEDGRRRLFLNKLGSAIKSGWNEVVDFVKDPIGTLADVVDKGVKFVKEAKKAAMKIVKQVGGEIAKDLGVAGVLNKIGKEFQKFKKLGNLNIKDGFNKLMAKAGKTFTNIAKKLASVVSGMFACLPFPKLITVRDVMETIERLLDLPVVSTIMNALEVAMNAIISELGLDKLLVLPGLPDINIDFAEEWVEEIKGKLSAVKDDIQGFAENMFKAVPDLCYPLPPAIAETFKSVKAQFTVAEGERRQLEDDDDDDDDNCMFMMNPRDMLEGAMERYMVGQILFDEDENDPRAQRRDNTQLDLDVAIPLGIKANTKYEISNESGRKRIDVCIFAAAREDKCLGIKAENSDVITIFENVYDGTRYEETLCYKRDANGVKKKKRCSAAYAASYDSWDPVDQKVHMYLVEKSKCQNQCQKCTSSDFKNFETPTKTIHYKAKTPSNGWVDFTLNENEGKSGAYEVKSYPFGCFRENGGNYEFLPDGELKTQWYWQCVKNFKDDYDRKYEIFHADKWTNTGDDGVCVQPGAFMSKSQKSKDFRVCVDRSSYNSPTNRVKRISTGIVTGSATGTTSTSIELYADTLDNSKAFLTGDELCFVPASKSCSETDDVPVNDKFCPDIENYGGHADVTVKPRIDSNKDVQHFSLCYKHFLRGWAKQTGIIIRQNSKDLSGSLDSLEVVHSTGVRDCVPKPDSRRALAPEPEPAVSNSVGRLISGEASRRQLAKVFSYDVADCGSNQFRFNVVIRGLNGKKIDFRVTDPEGRGGLIRTTFDGLHGWAYYPGESQLAAFDSGAAKRFWNHDFAKGTYNFWIDYGNSDSELNCWYEGDDKFSSTVQKSFWNANDFTMSIYCDAAKKIAEFSAQKSNGWRMMHLLEQPPTSLTIKGNFEAGDEVRFVPIYEPCTYGNGENENVDRQTFRLNAVNEATVQVQLQSNIQYYICAREQNGEWVYQNDIHGALKKNSQNIWEHWTDSVNCPSGWIKNANDVCEREANTGDDAATRRNLANATGPGGNASKDLKDANATGPDGR